MSIETLSFSMSIESLKSMSIIRYHRERAVQSPLEQFQMYMEVLFAEHLGLEKKKVAKIEKRSKKYIDKMRKEEKARQKEIRQRLKAAEFSTLKLKD